MLPNLSTQHRRTNELNVIANPLPYSKVNLSLDDKSDEYHVFNLADVIKDKIERTNCDLMESYATDCIPSFLKEIKAKYGADVVTSFFDSPSHDQLLLTVPFDQRPPIFISLYADALDRDQILHSSGRNKIHCTYLRVLNAAKFGLRKRDDYELVMLVNESTIKAHGYDLCHQPLLSQLVDLISSGMMIRGKRHAVRLAYLQVRKTSFNKNRPRLLNILTFCYREMGWNGQGKLG